MNWLKLKGKALLCLLPLFILSLIILASTTFVYSKKIILQDIQNQVSTLLDSNINLMNGILDKHGKIAQLLAKDMEATSGRLDENTIKEILFKYASSNEDTMGAGVWFEPYQYKKDLQFYGPYAYKDGSKMVFTMDYSTEKYNYPSQPWYKAAIDTDKPYVFSDPYYDETTKITMVTTTAPFYKDGKLFGTATADINLATIQKKISQIRIAKTGNAFLLSSDGTYLVNRDSSKVMKTKLSEEKNKGLISLWQSLTKGEKGFSSYENGGEKYLVFYAPLKTTNWYLLIEVPEKELFAENLYPLLNKIIFISLFSIILVSCILYFLVRFLIKRILNIKEVMEKVAEGDLSVVSSHESNDELGELSESINGMLKNINSLIHQVKENGKNTLESAQSLAATAEQAAATTTQVTRATEEITKAANKQNNDIGSSIETLNILAQKIEQANAIAQNVHTIANQAHSLTQESKGTVNTLQQASEENSIASEKVGASIQSLNEKSQEIDQIIQVITSIADQTNLLALNAAIEAARAGEQGRGFAVVAEEVRQLAEQSAQAAKEISLLIQEIQKQTEGTVAIMDKTKDIVNSQNEAVNNTNNAFTNIIEAVQNIIEQINNISSSFREMEAAKNEALTTMKHVAAVSEETAAANQEVLASTEEQGASVEEVASAANMLSGIANSLQGAINKFKI